MSMGPYRSLACMAALLVLSVSYAAAGGPSPSFSSDVQPILDANCVACHQTGSAQRGLILERGKSYVALVGQKSKEANLLLVQPHDAEASYLIRKVTGRQVQGGGGGSRMPLGGELDAPSIEIMQAWIEAGAENN
jgi:hypothetical protein